MPELAPDSGDAGVDYISLARELIEPLLDSPDSLRVNCEYAKNRERVLIRVAFEETDQGRVFGRGGRNIQAIRITIEAAAQLSGQIARLEVFESGDRPHGHPDSDRHGSSDRRGGGNRRRSSRPPRQRASS